jgi:hypothetical protein
MFMSSGRCCMPAYGVKISRIGVPFKEHRRLVGLLATFKSAHISVILLVEKRESPQRILDSVHV